jgi:hypothetical protein
MSEKITISREKYHELLTKAGIEIITHEQASKQISAKVSQINKLIEECVEVSKIADFDFQLSIGGRSMYYQEDPYDNTGNRYWRTFF